MDKINVKGSGTMVITQGDGSVIAHEFTNIVVTVGKGVMASRMKDATADPISHMAIGSSNQVATEADTDIVGTEHERVAATVTVTGNSVEVVGSFGAGIGAPVTVGEFGIFNHASAGDLICRFTVPEITLDAAGTILTTWTIQFGD